MNIQLTPASGYDVNNIMCSEPRNGEINSGDDKDKKKESSVSFQRINISTKYPDGTVGDLIIPTSELFSFGVGENTSKETGRVTGHTMSLCMWNRDRTTQEYIPTQEQLDWTTTYNNVVDKIKSILIDYHKKDMLTAGSFTKYRYAKDADDAEENGGYTTSEFKVQLRKLNNLYWGKGKKNAKMIEEGVYENGPTLYAKLIESKKDGVPKIVTQFYDYNDNPLDPLTQLMGVYSNVCAAIKIESIFIGNTISLQTKLYEANCKVIETGVQRLLPRPKVDNRLLMGGSSSFGTSQQTPAPAPAPATNDDDETGSLKDEDEEEEEVKEEPKKIKKKKKRVVKQIE